MMRSYFCVLRDRDVSVVVSDVADAMLKRVSGRLGRGRGRTTPEDRAACPRSRWLQASSDSTMAAYLTLPATGQHRQEEPMSRTIMLIHGAWLNAQSWEGFKARYEAEGYTVIAPSWPLDDRSP